MTLLHYINRDERPLSHRPVCGADMVWATKSTTRPDNVTCLACREIINQYYKKPPPKFQVGEAVVSFRGEAARIQEVYPSDHPGKSHRVQVTWNDNDRNPDRTTYYEEVFEFPSEYKP